MGKPLARTDVDDISQFIHARNIVCSRNLLDMLVSAHGVKEPAPIKKPIAVAPPSKPQPNIEPKWWHTMWFGGLVDIEAPLPGEPLSVSYVQSVVAKSYGVTKLDIISSKRTHKFVLPRQIAIYLAKTLTTRSYPDISRRFGNRDHTTAIHSCNKISARCVSDPEFAIKIAALKAEILA